jgi:hypothetical protein
MSGREVANNRRGVRRRPTVLAGPVLVAASVGLMWPSGSASAAAASVAITPAVSGGASGPYQDGETVKISVGQNGTFQAGTRVNILECADPGGSVANLPKNNSTCDGLTIQGDTVLVGANGTISYPSYTLYRLPSSTLGERPAGQPVCNESNLCVLYVGVNQNAFAQPKVFSAPFTVASSSTTASSPSTSVTPSVTLPGAEGTSSTASSTSTAGGSPSTTVGSAGPALSPLTAAQSGSLAATGVPRMLLWIVASGCLLAIVGDVGRRRFREVGT